MTGVVGARNIAMRRGVRSSGGVAVGESFTYAVGDVVRLDRKPHKVTTIHLNGSVSLVGPKGLRTVDASRLSPARKGDVVVTLSAPGFARRGR